MKHAIKRAMDITVSATALIAFLPVLIVIAVLIRWRMGTPVLFSQWRPGLHGQPFRMFKFRTMRDAYDADGKALGDIERLTQLGAFLRSTSLDELPELWNVLIGEMSLVGPRPLMMVYLDRYTAYQHRRHDVKPGVTGWAQVNGRNAIGWPEKFDLDVWYVDNQSLMLDLKIMWKTIGEVLSRRGVSHAGEATMPEFMGSDDE